MTHRMKTPTQIIPRARVKREDFAADKSAYAARRCAKMMRHVLRTLDTLRASDARSLVAGWMRDEALDAVAIARLSAVRREALAGRRAA